MPLSDVFLVTGASPAGLGDAVCGVNCVRPRGEAQEVIYCPARRGGPADAQLQCTYTRVPDRDAAYAIVATKAAWMWGVEAGANECGVAVFCVATTRSVTNSEAHHKGYLLAQDLARLGLERGSTASSAFGAVCEIVQQRGLGEATTVDDSVIDDATYACLMFVDKSEVWLVEIAGKLWAARQLKGDFCCLSHSLCTEAPFDKASSSYLLENNDRSLANASAEHRQDMKDGKRYCLRQRATHEGQTTMFQHLRNAAAATQLSHSAEAVTSMVSVFSATSDAAVHWFTATPDPNISIFKPFVFHSQNKQCTLTHVHENGASESEKCALVAEQSTSTVRLRNNDGKLRDILLQLESECEQEMSCYIRRTADGSGSYDSEGLGTIFNELCEAEIKFYKKASV